MINCPPLCAWIEISRWCSGKESACRCRILKRCRFDLWIRKIPHKRTWQPTPIFLPGKFHGQRSLVGYSPWGRKESDMTEHGLAHTGTWVVAVIQTQNQPNSVLSGLMVLLLSSKHPGNKDKTAKSLGHSIAALHHDRKKKFLILFV